jgi:Zinc knuckle
MERAPKVSTQADHLQTGQGQGQKRQSGSTPSKSQGQKSKGKNPEKKQADTPQMDKSRSWGSNRSQTEGMPQESKGTRSKSVVCYSCNKPGHYANKYLDKSDNKKKDKESKNSKP